MQSKLCNEIIFYYFNILFFIFSSNRKIEQQNVFLNLIKELQFSEKRGIAN